MRTTTRRSTIRFLGALTLALAAAAALAGPSSTVYVYDGHGNLTGVINTATDWANCGAVDTACASGAACCDGRCTSTATDGANCGACGQVCGPGTTCDGGHCVQTPIGGGGGQCTGGTCCAAPLVSCGGLCCATCPCGLEETSAATDKASGDARKP